MPRYAEGTQVSSESSKAEIERVLMRYGAESFMYATDRTRAAIQFRVHEKMVRIVVPLPDRDADEFRLTPSRAWERSKKDWDNAYEQAVRQRWRALKLVVQAKLEAIDAGIATFDDEFLAYMVLPDGSRYGEWAAPQLAAVFAQARFPQLLPGDE